MTLEASVSIGWVNTLVAAARRLGVAEEELLVLAGIQPDALQQERWPIDDITRLWHAAEQATRDPGLGLKVGARFNPVSIQGLGFALQSAANLRAAITQMQRFQRLISDGGRFQLLAGPQATWIVYHPRQGRLAFSPQQIEAVLAAVIGFSLWATGSHLQPEQVQFGHSRQGPLEGYNQVFSCPIEFEQGFSGLLVDNQLLDQPLPQADPQLAQVHERITAERLAALSQEGFSEQGLRQWLQARLGPVLPRRSDAAQAWGLSERTLARRLAALNKTFEGLLDDVRREQALQAVENPDRALAEIAETLGFAEVSSFYRAFKRWTGCPPVRWRQQVRAASLV